MIDISIIVPTLNRSAFLKEALQSILNQDFPKHRYEIIVIDNGSTDETKPVFDSLQKANEVQMSYFAEVKPGLHIGRHRGAKEARADILVFVDDDVIAIPSWLSCIWEAFQGSDAVLVGGNNLPDYECDPPGWLHHLWIQCQYGKYLSLLSLIHFNIGYQEIPPWFIYGCNFSISRKILFEAGGFHPDGMPTELIRYRGDGESHVSHFIAKHHLKAYFHPGATLYHRVPSSRMTREYFCRRSFYQGISDSFTSIRQTGGSEVQGLLRYLAEVKAIIRNILRPSRGEYGEQRIKKEPKSVKQIRKDMHNAFQEGQRYHKSEIRKDPTLLSYVLKDSFF